MLKRYRKHFERRILDRLFAEFSKKTTEELIAIFTKHGPLAETEEHYLDRFLAMTIQGAAYAVLTQNRGWTPPTAPVSRAE